VKKRIIFFGVAIFYSLNALSQNMTMPQWLDAADTNIKNEPKFAQAAKVNFDIGTYGICSNVGLAVAAGYVKGQKFEQKTLFTAAHLIKLADVYRKQAIASGTPPEIFDNSLQSTLYFGQSQTEFEKGFQRCSMIFGKIVLATK